MKNTVKSSLLACVSTIAIGSVATFGSSTHAYAQSENEAAVSAGTVTGRVVEADKQAALDGARVTVVETGQSTITNRLGEYRFALPEGDYTLQIEYLGLNPEETQVSVVAGRQETVDFALSAIDVIIVTGRLSATAGALNQQRNSDVVSNVISADSLGRFPDTSAAEALNRLPGVSFQRERRSGDGQFISIRGLDSALNNVQINGVNSAQANAGGEGGSNRRIPLDVFQAESISKITINKSLLPHHESDGIGGSVELETVSPLELGKDTFRVSAEGRWQEVNPGGPGYRIGGTASKVFSDNLGILVSGSFRRRERVAFEQETVLGIGGSPLPLFLPASFDQPGVDDEGVLRAPFPGTAADHPASVVGLQFNYFDDTRKDTTLSGVIDWRPFENTTWKFSASYNKEDVTSLRSTTSPSSGERDDEDGDPDDDILPLVADGLTFDLADLYPNFNNIPRGQFIVNGGDEIFAVAEPEVRLRFEAEPEENTNLTFGFQGETIIDRWKFNYGAGFARATDGFSNGPRPQFDFEPEDFDDQDYIDFLNDNGITGILPSDLFPNGEVFTTSDSGVGNGVLAPGSDSGFSDGRLFFLINNQDTIAPQIANVNEAALQQLFLTPEVHLLNGYTLDFERGEQNRYFAEFDVEYTPDLTWVDYIRTGFKFETAQRESFDLEIARFNSGRSEAILLEALGDIDTNSDGDLSVAEVNSVFGLISDDNISLSDFNGIYPFDILRGTISGLDASEEIFNNFLANIATTTTGIELDDVIGDIPLPDDFDPATQNFLDFIPVEEVDEQFFSGYFMGKLNFGPERRWELIGGVRIDHARVDTLSTQAVSIETVDRDGLGRFVGAIDGGPLDGDDAFVDASGNVFDSGGTLLGVRDTETGGTVGVDLDTSTTRNVSLLQTDSTYTEVLPRMQLNYRASDNIVFRGAVWTAIARPAFEDLSAAGEIEFEESTEDPGETARLSVEFGNPNLNNSYAWNFDLGVEYYFGNVGVITLNAFYKTIDDFIFVDLTPVIDLDSPSVPEGLENAAPELFSNNLIDLVDVVNISQAQGGTDATIYGIEASVQRRLDFLPGFARDFGIFANITWQDPEADVLLSDGSVVALPFFNSPEVVSTVSAYYDAYGIDAALTWSYQSDQLSEFNNNFSGAIFEPDHDQLDLSVKYTLPISGPTVVLSLNVQDILNPGDDPVTQRDFGRQGRLLDEVQFVGRSFFFGASVAF